ncbi:MAG: glycosyltransferase family 2 protein [Bacteroidota bacterium]
MGIKVSAIVSTYKAERFIASRLRNLLKMPIYIRGELEIIIIDSNSPENEREIVERFQQSFRNISYIRTPQRESVYQAWNRGIECAQGEYIINANTDDLFIEPSLSIMSDYLDNHSDYDAVYGNWIIQEQEYKPYPTSRGSKEFTYDHFFPPLLFYYQVTSHAALMRKKTVEVLGGYDTKLEVFGDRKLMFKFAEQGFQAKHLDIAEGVYLKNNEGIEHGTDIKTKEKESYSIYNQYKSPTQLLRLWGINEEVKNMPSKLIADLYSLTAILGVRKVGANNYHYINKKLALMVEQALVFSPKHWLSSLIFATILSAKGKKEIAIQVLNNAQHPPKKYWLHGNVIETLLSSIRGSEDINIEDVVYSFNQIYLDDVKSELDNGAGDQQVFQKRWGLFQDILGRRYLSYLDFNQAIALMKQNKLQRAEDHLISILETGWNAHVVISFLVKISSLRDNKRRALSLMQRLIKEKRDTPHNHITVIRQLQQYEYFEEVENQIEQACSVVDDDHMLAVESCRALLGKGDFKSCMLKLRELRGQYLSSKHQLNVDKLWDKCLRKEMGGEVESNTRVKLPFDKLSYPENPLVSVLVSTYDAESYIESCLRDLLSQTIAPRLEIIVIDSASPGNEKDIVQQYQERYKNIVYRRTNQRESLYKAWNRALAIARAPFVTNANTDDRHRVDALERMSNFLSQHVTIGLVYGNYISTRKPNLVFSSNVQGHSKQINSYSQDILIDQCLPGPQPMWRRDIHDEFGHFDPSFKTAGDYEFWIRISARVTMHHLNEYLGIYLHRDDSLEHKNLNLSRQEGEMIREKYGSRIESLRKSALHHPLLSNTYVQHSEMAK